MSDAQRGSQSPQNKTANTTGQPFLKLQDGALSLSCFSKARKAGGDEYVFAIPERAYKSKDGQWVNTSTLHVDDLLPMAFLLMQAHGRIRSKIEHAGKE